MPLSLSRAFTETHSFTSSRINEYADGASQRTALLSIGAPVLAVEQAPASGNHGPPARLLDRAGDRAVLLL